MAARHANVVVRHLSNNHITMAKHQDMRETVRNVTAALRQVDDLSNGAKTHTLNALIADMGEISGCSECTAILSDGVALTLGNEEAG